MNNQPQLESFTRRIMAILAVVAFVAMLGFWIASAFAADKKPAARDAPARQTAQPWTGSPLEFEYANRDKTLRLDRVFRELKLNRGKKVADVGAGGGWLSVRLARRVGPSGVVYAQEILPRYVEFLGKRAKQEGLTNLRPILGTITDPKLPQGLDAVVILNAYHEFDQPLVMLRHIISSMKPGARLAFIERDNDDLRREASDAYAKTGQIKRRVDEKPDNNSYTDDHRLALPIVEREAASVGLRKVRSLELGDDHYLLVVENPKLAKRRALVRGSRLFAPSQKRNAKP